MKTILIAGGLDSMPAEETSTIPKAMVDIGGRPLMTRLMDVYSHFGHNDFIVAAGHQSVAIKQFFADYHLMANDVRVAIDTGKIDLHPTHGITPAPAAASAFMLYTSLSSSTPTGAITGIKSP